MHSSGFEENNFKFHLLNYDEISVQIDLLDNKTFIALLQLHVIDYSETLTPKPFLLC